MSRQTATTNSGIQTLRNGEAIIPASTRADGSLRKAIRVKPGYKPPEDVEVYKNRTAEAWKSRGKGGVPGAQMADHEEAASQKASASKNAKRREARRKAAVASASGPAETSNKDRESNSRKDSPMDEGEKPQGVGELNEHASETERVKDTKKLTKKLRQARDLAEKRDQGESLLPEQIIKVTKINELVRQLEALGFDKDRERRNG